MQIQQAHELEGRIALAEKDYGKAIAELEQANLQNPRNLYRLSLAYGGKGDTAKAQEYLVQAAGFNPLPQLDYAFIRGKAQRLAANKKAASDDSGLVPQRDGCSANRGARFGRTASARDYAIRTCERKWSAREHNDWQTYLAK